MWQQHIEHLNGLFGPGWQDYVITVGQWIFLVALVPSIRSDDKPALSSSILTASILCTFCYAFATLGLLNSSISCAAVATAWWVLAWQKWRSQ